MSKWQRVFSDLVTRSAKDDLLAQVGHTVGGKSISMEGFESLAGQILGSLEVTENDTVLDLCCGNGIFTAKIAQRAQRTLGVDICRPLINIANAKFSQPGLSFHVADIRQDDLSASVAGLHRVNKVCFFAALQHFNQAEFRDIIFRLTSQCENLELIHIGFIPDAAKSGIFYNTVRRKITRVVKLVTFDNNFGRWWSRREIEQVCEELGAQCKFSQLPLGLHATMYRFNVLINMAKPE